MNTLPNNGLPSDPQRRDSYDSYGTGEDTLRLIAGLPAPEKLPERVKAGMRSAPVSGRILMWRGPLRPAGGWMYGTAMRGAAAAAIVCVVAGGGWSIYSRVQPAPAAKVIVTAPPVAPAASGFSNSGARRVPETLDGPVLAHPVVAVPEVNPEVNVVQKAPTQRGTVPRQPANKKKKPRAAAPPMQ